MTTRKSWKSTDHKFCCVISMEYRYFPVHVILFAFCQAIQDLSIRSGRLWSLNCGKIRVDIKQICILHEKSRFNRVKWCECSCSLNWKWRERRGNGEMLVGWGDRERECERIAYKCYSPSNCAAFTMSLNLLTVLTVHTVLPRFHVHSFVLFFFVSICFHIATVSRYSCSPYLILITRICSFLHTKISAHNHKLIQMVRYNEWISGFLVSTL